MSENIREIPHVVKDRRDFLEEGVDHYSTKNRNGTKYLDVFILGFFIGAITSLIIFELVRKGVL